MKKYASALALAAVLAAPTAAQAEVDFGGDFLFTGYRVDTGAADDTAAYRQITRLKAHFKNADGVQVHTRLLLNANVWAGDAYASTSTNDQGITTGGDVGLDYGFVHVPLGGTWALRVGRQEANWGFNFNTSDDRRDRILLMGKVGGTTLLFLNDKRIEGLTTSDDDDGDMYSAAAIGTAGGWLWGVVGAYFKGWGSEGYSASDVILVSPFIKGKIGSVSLEGTYNFTGNGEYLWTDSSHAAFLRGGMNLGALTAELQGVLVIDGGLVAGGWDSFSSLIHNSPDNYPSPTRIGGLNIGGLGKTDGPFAAFNNDNFDRYGLMGRLTWKSGKVKVMGALGAIHYDNDGADETVTFEDVQVHYQLTDSTTLWGTLGVAQSDDYIGEDVWAASVNLKTNF